MRKILSLLALVLLSCTGAWAQTYTLQLDVTQGAYYRANTVWTNAWLTNWKSNDFTLADGETTKVIVDTNSDGLNNMYNDRAANAKQDAGDMYFHIKPNTGGNYRPLTISLSNTNYDIESVTFTLKSSTNGNVVVKMPNGTNYTCTTESADQTITDYTVGASQLVIGFEETSNQVVISDVTVKVAKHIVDPDAPETFPSVGTYYMTIANHETGRNPYLYNDVDEATGFTLQAANLTNKTNGYIWRVTSDGNGQITEIVSGTGKGIVPNSAKFSGELTSLNYATATNSGYYYLTSDAIKAAGDHECLNASNGGQNNGHGIRTVTTWTGADKGDNHWKFEEEDLTDKFVYNVVIAAGAPAGAYVEFNGQKALNGGFFVVGASDFVNPTAAAVAGYDADVKVESQTITVTYTQTATPVDVEYNIFVDETKVATVTRSEFEGVAPTFALSAPAYVSVTQDVPGTITAGVTSYDIKTTYTEALPFKLDGTKYNIKENRNPALWIFYDGTGLKTVANQTPKYNDQDNYKWVIGGDWYNGFTLKNVGESKYVTYNSVNPADKTTAVLTETLGEGAYFDLVQSGTYNYFKIHGTTKDAYISNNGGPTTTILTNWNSAGNVGDAGAQLLFTEAEEIAAPTTPDWDRLTAAIEEAFKYQIGDNLGQYTYMAYGVADNETYYDFLSYCYQLNEDRTADVDDVEYAIEGLEEMIDALQLNMPQKGQMLRIVASTDWISTPTYLHNVESTAKTGRLAFVQEGSTYDEALRQSTIWIYDGQFLVNYTNGLTASNNGGFMNIAMYPSTTKIEFLPAANGAIGKYNIRFDSSRYLYTHKDLYTDAGSGANAEGYNFELEDATYYFFLDFGDKGWASAYFPIAVAANPEYGIDAAYYIKNDPENDCFKAEEVSGIIKPFTPVIIKVNSEAHSGTPFVKGAPNYTLEPEPSVLKGALWKQEKPEGCCVFNVVDGQPGFYGFSGTTLKHMKAYYEMPVGSSASALRINFGEEGITTAIQNAVDKAEFSGDVYDLQGRRINGVQQGVFVKNGRKIVK